MRHLIRSASLTHYVEIARAVGLDPHRQLALAGIDRVALLDPERKLPAEAVARLLEDSAHAAGAEDFGLRMAESRELSNLGPLALLLREEPTLRRAIEAMSRYMHLHTQALATHIEESGNLVVIREDVLHGPPGSQRQSSELAVAVLFRLLRLFLGAGWRPQSVCFMHSAPRDRSTQQRVFGMPVHFGQEFDGLVCRRQDLELPLPTYDPAMAQQVRRYLDTLLAQADTSMPDQVRQLVAGLLPLGVCSVERIAEQLGVDRRTVHHHLSRHGQSYTGILHSVRADLALRYLENRERPLSDVATLLGFSSLSAFSRWFGRHFGCSVRQWRAGGGNFRILAAYIEKE